MTTRLRTTATTATVGAVLLLSAACGSATGQATAASTQTTVSSAAASGGAASAVTAEPSRNVGPNSGGGPFDHTTGCSDWAPDPTQPVLAGISNSGVTLYTATPTSTAGQAQTCGAGSSDLPTRIPFGAVNPQDPTQLAWPATQGGKPGVWDVLSVTTNTLTPNVGTGTHTQGSTLVWKDGIPEQGLSLPVAAGSIKDLPVPATRGAVTCRTAEGAAAIVLNGAYDPPNNSGHDPLIPTLDAAGTATGGAYGWMWARESPTAQTKTLWLMRRDATSTGVCRFADDPAGKFTFQNPADAESDATPLLVTADGQLVFARHASGAGPAKVDLVQLPAAGGDLSAGTVVGELAGVEGSGLVALIWPTAK